MHHLVEKQRFKHVISLYYRAFLRCSWIKGPNFRTPMKAMGVLSPLKAGRCTPAHSGGRFKHTTHPPLPAGGNVHLSFCLYFLLAAGHLDPHPRPGNPPLHRARHCPPRPRMHGEVRQQPCAPERCIPRALVHRVSPGRCPGSRSALHGHLITLPLAVTCAHSFQPVF